MATPTGTPDQPTAAGGARHLSLVPDVPDALPRYKSKRIGPVLAPIGLITTPLEHVAALWPGFDQGKPEGSKAFFPVPSKRNPHTAQQADESLFVRYKVTAADRAADLASITNFLRDAQGQPDKYISVNTFVGRRTHENLRNLTALAIDLDMSKSKVKYEGDLAAVCQLSDAQDLISQAGIPSPNLAVSTGRGIHLYWMFDRMVPAAAFPRWKACMNQLIDLLKPIGADPMVRDTARVMRLVGTVNSRAYWKDEDGVIRQRTVVAQTLVPTRHSFDFLADQILPLTRAELEEQRKVNREKYKLKVVAAIEAGKPLPKPRSLTPQELAGNSKTGRYAAKALQRQADLELLASTVYPRGITEGNRDLYLFHASCNLAWTASSLTLERQILQFKNRFAPSLSNEETLATMGSVIRKAASAYKLLVTGSRVDIFDDPRYVLGDERMWTDFQRDIELAGLQGQMQAIVPTTVLAERAKSERKAKREASGADTYTGTGVRKSNLQAFEQAKEMRSNGSSLREIASALKKSAKTISLWLQPTTQPSAPSSHDAQVSLDETRNTDTSIPLPIPSHATSEPPPTPQSYPQAASTAHLLPNGFVNNGETSGPLTSPAVLEIESLTRPGRKSSASWLLALSKRFLAKRLPKPRPKVVRLKPNYPNFGKRQLRPVRPEIYVPAPVPAAPPPPVRLVHPKPKPKPKTPKPKVVAAPAPAPVKVWDLTTPFQLAVKELRGLDVSQGLERLVKLGWFVKEDRSFVPRKDLMTHRCHITASGHVYELVYTDRRWYLHGEHVGGAGIIDLVMKITGWPFTAAARWLTGIYQT